MACKGVPIEGQPHLTDVVTELLLVEVHEKY